jgi:hypothetical protein
VSTSKDPASRSLLVTDTGEPFQPVRLYFRLGNKIAVGRALTALGCIREDRPSNSLLWIYEGEAASLTFGVPRERIAPELHPIVLGRFKLPDPKRLVLEVRSIDRAVEAARFFAPVLREQASLGGVRVINRWFDQAEAGVGLDRLDKLLDANVVRVDAKDAERALERAMVAGATEDETQQAFEALATEPAKGDVPLVEDLPLTPQAASELRELSMTLQLRAMRAHEHWMGNASVTLRDVIHRFMGA